MAAANGPTSSSKPLDPGERAVRWIGNLTLCDDFQGQPFRLREWQAEIPRKVYGTLKPDGKRRYRKCLLMLPRKQAKTQLSAAIGAYSILGDRKPDGSPKDGQETIAAASDRAQASHLFRKASTMIEADPYLRRQAKVYHSSKVIETRKTGNVFKVVSADGRRQHGLNPSTLLFDELHTQPNRDLFDALTSAQQTRTEPLNLYISTAGNRRDSLCYEELQYALKVKADPSYDPSYLPIIYAADPEDDWTLETTWRKAMPALGDFCSLEFIRDEFRKALASPSEESKFRQFYLNQWVASSRKWINRKAWDACAGSKLERIDLAGAECFGGLDLSNTRDITAFVLVFPDGDAFEVVCHFWLPRDYAEQRDRAGTTQYLRWAEAGFITLTDGGYIDHELIWSKIIDLSTRHEIRSIRLDPFEATQTAKHLLAAGLPVEMMRQTFLTLNEPTKWLEILISKGRIRHRDNPVLTMMAENAVAITDAYGCVKIAKDKSSEKIDGLIALVMALSAAMGEEPEAENEVIFL